MTKALIAAIFVMIALMSATAAMSVWDAIERRMGRVTLESISDERAPEGVTCAYKRIGSALFPVRGVNGKHVCVEDEK